MNKSVLVLGGTGLSGPSLVRHLTEAGCNVAVFHRGEYEVELPPEVVHYHGEKTQLPDFRTDWEKLAPDVVVDMTAYTAADADLLVSTFANLAGRTIVISSIDVYLAYGRLHRTEPGDPVPVPLTETAALRSKLSADGPNYDKPSVERAAAADTRLPTTIVRYPAVYGPRDPLQHTAQYLRPMYDKRPHLVIEEGFADWRFSRGFADNLGHAIALTTLNDAATGQTYNVAEEPALTETQWAQAIADVVGWHGEIIQIPTDQLPPSRRVTADVRQHWIVDTTKIRTELDYREPVAQHAALQATAQWQLKRFEEQPSPDNEYVELDQALKLHDTP